MYNWVHLRIYQSQTSICRDFISKGSYKLLKLLKLFYFQSSYVVGYIYLIKYNSISIIFLNREHIPTIILSAIKIMLFVCRSSNCVLFLRKLFINDIIDCPQILKRLWVFTSRSYFLFSNSWTNIFLSCLDNLMSATYNQMSYFFIYWVI